MKVYETFCGIGGFSLGFKRAGFEIIGGCEIDPYARAVYAKNFGIEPDGDIRSIQSIQADIICGGFPCQDISNANTNRKGLEGERSGLWWELARIIKNSSPRWVVLENVSALLQQGSGMGDILRFFSEIGYDVEWDCLPASAFGANHQRDRVWIVAHPKSIRDRGVLRKLYSKDEKTSESKKQYENKAKQFINGSKTMADTERAGLHEGHINQEGQTSRQSWQQQTNWTIEPNMGRVAHGIPNRVDRLKCLGNAIVPQISEWIAKRIKEIEKV